MRDDAARRRFLEVLVDALGGGWSASYGVIAPYGVLGARLRHDGVDGAVEVVPSVVDRGVVSWRRFPGGGRPHYDISIDDGEHLRTCDRDDAVRVLDGWRRSRGPVARGAPEPMLAAMRPWLEAIARAPAVEVVDGVTAARARGPGRDRLADARGAVDCDRVARSFPRDDDGRLALGARVLLAELAPAPRRGARAPWLAVEGPVKRRDLARLRLVVTDEIGPNATHRWDAAPWLWRRGPRPRRGRGRSSAISAGSVWPGPGLDPAAGPR